MMKLENKLEWLDQLDISTLLASQDGGVIFANKKICDLLGFENNYLKTKKVFEVFDIATTSWDDFCKSQDKKPKGFFSFPKKNGDVLRTEVNFSEFNFENEALLFLQIKDLTPMEKMENLYRQKASLAYLGELTTGVSHEINNILAVIIGQLNVLEDKSEETGSVKSEVILEKCHSISEKSFKVSKIINSLKLFHPKYSQIEKERAVTFKSLVNEIKNLYQEKFKQKNIEFKISNLDSLDKIRCYPTKLSQALLMLIKNFVLSCDEQVAPWISIDFIINNNQVEICVESSGQKLSEADQAKLLCPRYLLNDQSQLTSYDLPTISQLVKPSQGLLIYNTNKENMSFSILIPN